MARRSDFEARVDPSLTYGENLSLIQERLKVKEAPSRGKTSLLSRSLPIVVMVLLLLSVAALFGYRSTSDVGSMRTSAKEASIAATDSVWMEHKDARLVSVRTGDVPRSSFGSLLNPAECPTDGRSLSWNWRFHSNTTGRLILVTTRGKTVERTETILDESTPSGSEAWKIDSTEAARFAVQTMEVSWRGDGLLPVELELAWSEERDAFLWFVTFLQWRVARVSRAFIVVIDADTGGVLYMMERIQ